MTTTYFELLDFHHQRLAEVAHLPDREQRLGRAVHRNPRLGLH